MTQLATLSAEDARALTDEIRGAEERLWELLLRAWEGRAYRALGYGTWEEYVRAEFAMRRRRSYQLLDQARVAQAITDAITEQTKEMCTMVHISEREAREIKPVLPTVTEAVRERVEAGQDPSQAVREVVEGVRKKKRQARSCGGETGHENTGGEPPIVQPDAPPRMARARVGARELMVFIRAAIDAASAASDATDKEVDAIPTNDLMVAGLSRARDLADRIIRRHSAVAKPARR